MEKSKRKFCNTCGVFFLGTTRDDHKHEGHEQAFIYVKVPKGTPNKTLNGLLDALNP